MTRTLLANSILLPSLFGQGLIPVGQDQLEHARAVNIQRAATLPNFVADELVKRYKSRHVDPPQWRYVDTIEAEIVVHGAQYIRQHTRLNDKPWNRPDFPEFSWSVQFGCEIRPLFGPECHTAIEFDGREELRGRQLLAYRYHSPRDGCFGAFGLKNGFLSARRSYNPARTGRFLIDDPGGNIIQFEENARDFPKGFGYDAFRETMSWDYVTIADSTWLLPITADISTGFTAGDRWHVVVEYKNHRHFEASTNITFQ